MTENDDATSYDFVYDSLRSTLTWILCLIVSVHKNSAMAERFVAMVVVVAEAVVAAVADDDGAIAVAAVQSLGKWSPHAFDPETESIAAVDLTFYHCPSSERLVGHVQ